jgi:hypothetical protein
MFDELHFRSEKDDRAAESRVSEMTTARGVSHRPDGAAHQRTMVP